MTETRLAHMIRASSKGVGGGSVRESDATRRIERENLGFNPPCIWSEPGFVFGKGAFALLGCTEEVGAPQRANA
ncbi:protein of unknown function [Magnetospira sp. QH-2]|nr:protein of unknown function [Magnetospira sp. QH-2]